MIDEVPEFTTKIDGLHPIFARYDVAAAGLHRRSAHDRRPGLNALLATAADVADMPLCLFQQDDVPSELTHQAPFSPWRLPTSCPTLTSTSSTFQTRTTAIPSTPSSTSPKGEVLG
jgi:hypothetical protein